MVDALLAPLAVLVPLLLAVALFRPFGPVSRQRVERFARRQALVVTPDNGPRVIAYLATTRRWRSTGLVIAFAVEMAAATASGDHFSASGLQYFGFWAAGAVIAEWRLGRGQRDGVRRAASLVPRRLGDYVSAGIRTMVALAFVGALAIEVTLVCVARRDRLVLLAWPLATVAVVAAIALVARHILTRPQPVAAIDVERADDALRSRSLHVLIGCALAAAGFLMTSAQGIAARDTVWGDSSVPDGVLGMASVLLVLLGLFAATSTFAARRDRYVHEAAT